MFANPCAGSREPCGQDRFAGPLGPLEAGVRGALAEEGFAPQSARYVIDRMRRLSRWMEQRNMEPGGLTPEAVAEFLADSSELQTAGRGLGTLLRLLRSQSVIPPEHDSAGDSAAGMLLAQYRDYLAGERGLAAESVRCYLVQGRKLLDGLGEPIAGGPAAAGRRGGHVVHHAAVPAVHEHLVGQDAGHRDPVAAAVPARQGPDHGAAGGRGPGRGRLAAQRAAPRPGAGPGRGHPRRPGPGIPLRAARPGDPDAAGPAGAARRRGRRAAAGGHRLAGRRDHRHRQGLGQPRPCRCRRTPGRRWPTT